MDEFTPITILFIGYFLMLAVGSVVAAWYILRIAFILYFDPIERMNASDCSPLTKRTVTILAWLGIPTGGFTYIIAIIIILCCAKEGCRYGNGVPIAMGL